MDKVRLSIAMAIVVGIAVLISACSESEKVDVVAVEQPVKVVHVASSLKEPQRRFPGQVVAAGSSNVASKVSGQVIALHAQPGDRVTVGELLIEIDPTDYRLNVEQAQANYNLANTSYNRINSSFTKGVTTQANVDDAKANLELARVSLAQATNQLAHTKIYSQLEGIVVSVNPKTYDFISAAQTLMYIQSSQKNIDVKFQVPSNIVARINSDINTTMVDVVFSAIPSQSFKAKLKEFSADSDRSTRSYDVTLSILNPPSGTVNLLPGMDATVILDLSIFDAHPSLTVPSHIVFKQGSNAYVWRVENNKVTKTAVELGELRGDQIIIKSGVNENDTVVAAGINRLVDQQSIFIWSGK